MATKKNQDEPEEIKPDTIELETKEEEVTRKDSKWFDTDDMKVIMMRVMRDWYGRDIKDLETNQSGKFILYFNEDMK